MMHQLRGVVLAAAAGLAGLSTGAQATVLQFGSGDITSGSFGNSHIAEGDFTDTLTFDITSVGKLGASLTSAASELKAPGDIDFTSVTLDGPSGSFDFTIRNNDNADGLTDSAVLTQLLDPGSYTFTIVGHSYGDAQYGGNTTIQAAAVPEPASWAMMIVGFGAVGGAMRRRNRTSVKFA
jgi:hypothetical protein